MANHPSNINAKVVQVTPTLAQNWLKTNFSNRRLQERTIALYARDMEAGNWALNGEAIKIASDDTLLDGQHRLHAVVKAKTTVPMLVITGLPRQTQETMDVGKKRSASDTLLLRGETNTTALSAILRRVVLWDRGLRKSFNEPVSTAEMSMLLDKCPEIRRSADIAIRTHNTYKCLPKSSLGTAHHLLSRVDTGQATWFFERIADGADLPKGHPVLVLRERGRNEATSGERADDTRALAYVIRAWNMYRKKEMTTKIQHGKGTAVPDPQ